MLQKSLVYGSAAPANKTMSNGPKIEAYVGRFPPRLGFQGRNKDRLPERLSKGLAIQSPETSHLPNGVIVTNAAWSKFGGAL